jgi:inhibitor of cysteine peptidase
VSPATKRWIRVFAAVLSFAVTFSACTKSDGATVNLLETDSDRTVELLRGDKLVIEVEGSPTTGYSWEVVSLDAKVLKQQGDTEYRQGQPGTMGGGGTFTLTFQAAGKGKTELTMVYHQPWDKDTPPAKTMNVTVIVN